MEKKYKLWDAIECELIDIDTPKEARDILIENYTDGNTSHPDLDSCLLMEVLEHPLNFQDEKD